MITIFYIKKEEKKKKHKFSRNKVDITLGILFWWFYAEITHACVYLYMLQACMHVYNFFL